MVRRVARVLWVALVVGSFQLFAVSVTVMVRSHFVADMISLSRADGTRADWWWRRASLLVSRGGLRLAASRAHGTGVPGSAAVRLPVVNGGGEVEPRAFPAGTGSQTLSYPLPGGPVRNDALSPGGFFFRS